MRQPVIYTPEHIQNWDIQSESSDGRWVAARPVGHSLFPLLWRWKVALKVLIGAYDAIRWESK